MLSSNVSTLWMVERMHVHHVTCTVVPSTKTNNSNMSKDSSSDEHFGMTL